MSRYELLTRYAAGERNFSNVDLRRANLSGVYLRGVELSDADLQGAKLVGADLRCASLCNAYLWGVDLSGSDLRRANLSGANLWGVNISSTDLSGTVGNGKEIKSLQCGVYTVSYTATHITIGCQSHPIQDWWRFDDDEIDAMDPRSLEWWRVWKPILQQIIEVSPATPTGHERKEEGVK